VIAIGFLVAVAETQQTDADKSIIKYDCNIAKSKNEDSYIKTCKTKKVNKGDEEEATRKKLGPELNPDSPLKAVPAGYERLCKTDGWEDRRSPPNVYVVETYCLLTT